MRAWCIAAALIFVASLAAAQGKPDPPPPQGCTYVAFHAYSECKGTGNDKVWYVVTDGLYTCANGRAPGRQRVDEIKTNVRCDGPNAAPPPTPQTQLTVGLQGDCQSPVKEGELIVQECIDNLWYNVKYLRYRCLNGAIRLDAPRYFATDQPCGGKQAAPPIDAGNLGSEKSAPARANVSLPTFDLSDAAEWSETARATPRDSETQRMIIDRLTIQVPGAHVAFNDRVSATIRALLAGLRSVLEGPASRSWGSRTHTDGGVWIDPLGWEGVQGVTRATRVHAYLTSLGTSQGEAFDIQIVNDGTEPVRIDGDGIVVEPIKKGAEKPLRAELQQIVARGSGATAARANAYCLEFKLKPPEQGSMFKISDARAQQQYAAAREILRASRRLQEAQQLTPDSDPADYFHSIRQWSIWVNEQKFTLAAYRTAFLERTKKNVEAMHRKWSKDIETALIGYVPHRWDEITKILREAHQPVPDR